jgi:hypothetical protein
VTDAGRDHLTMADMTGRQIPPPEPPPCKRAALACGFGAFVGTLFAQYLEPALRLFARAF